MIGKGMVKGEMNAHKAMAGAGSSGSFGVDKLPGQGVQTQKHVESFAQLQDGQRATGPGLGGGKGGHAKQASPDHGDAGRDHFSRGGSGY